MGTAIPPSTPQQRLSYKPPSQSATSTPRPPPPPISTSTTSPPPAPPPFNTNSLAQDLARMYTGMAAFFHDDKAHFKVFLRHDPRKCASGNGLHNSFIYGYTDLFPSPLPQTYVLQFLAHETAHNWPRLQMDDTDMADQWWTEGIAEYYSIVLPYRLGITDRETFVKRMNVEIGAYFANPMVAERNERLVELFWKDHYAQRMVYERGFAYFTLFSEAIPRLSNNTTSLHALILEMVLLQRANKPYDINTWLTLLASAIGREEAYNSYNAIRNGTLFVPAPDSLGDDYILRPTEQEQFYLGVDASAFSPSGPGQRVKGLDLGSRAAVKGGLRETDFLTPRSTTLSLAEEFGEVVRLVVLREVGGKMREVKVRWWPRTWERIRSWQWEKVED